MSTLCLPMRSRSRLMRSLVSTFSISSGLRMMAELEKLRKVILLPVVKARETRWSICTRPSSGRGVVTLMSAGDQLLNREGCSNQTVKARLAIRYLRALSRESNENAIQNH